MLTCQDEYDPQSRTTSVKSHDGHVLRSRRKRRLKTLESDVDSLTSSTSSRSIFSTIEQLGDVKITLTIAVQLEVPVMGEICRSKVFQPRHEPEDAITNWAVLVGKALWCYMKGAGQVGQRPLANLSELQLWWIFFDVFHFFHSFEVKSWVWFPRLSTLDLVDVVTPKRATNQSLMKGRGPVAMLEVVF